jgi:hypothetical protein
MIRFAACGTTILSLGPEFRSHPAAVGTNGLCSVETAARRAAERVLPSHAWHLDAARALEHKHTVWIFKSALEVAVGNDRMRVGTAVWASAWRA